MSTSVHPAVTSYDLELGAIQDYRRFAALTIQRFYRGWIVRLHKQRQEAASIEQGRVAAAQHEENQRLHHAARLIQDTWRGCRNKRIFRFYRDLIRFRETLHPRAILRCINACEAALVEPATGLYVRFRLGGSSFPPILLYKVFTRRPVTDICAFGPRNYAAEATTSRSLTAAGAATSHANTAVEAHSRSCRTNISSAVDGSSGFACSGKRTAAQVDWYSREDNNGWRPVVELQEGLDHPTGVQLGAAMHQTGASNHSRRLIVRLHRRRRCNGSSSSRKKDCESAEKDLQHSGYHSEPDLQSAWEYGGVQSLHGQQRRSFHHNPVVRRAQQVQRLKQRRRQWLLKMYRAGMQATSGQAEQANSNPKASSESDHRSTHSQQPQNLSCDSCSKEEDVLQHLERQLWLARKSSDPGSCRSNESPKKESENSADCEWTDVMWEIDELHLLGLDAGILAWAQQLDFDSYQQQWSSTAVTLGPDTYSLQCEKVMGQEPELASLYH